MTNGQQPARCACSQTVSKWSTGSCLQRCRRQLGTKNITGPPPQPPTGSVRCAAGDSICSSGPEGSRAGAIGYLCCPLVFQPTPCKVNRRDNNHLGRATQIFLEARYAKPAKLLPGHQTSVCACSASQGQLIVRVVVVSCCWPSSLMDMLETDNH
jgi:hypothetical protein